MNCMGIYAIHYDGNVIYVGQSVLIARRCNQHIRSLELRKHRNFVLQRIYDKHPDLLTFSVLEVIERRDGLTRAEQRWMDEIKPAANLSRANGSHVHTDEARAKMRAYVRTIEHRRRLSEARKGRAPANKGKVGVFRHTDEARAKISAAGRGRTITEEQRRHRSESQKGRVFTEEHRRKLAAAKLGKPKAESARIALIGRTLSPEHRLKISESLRRRYGSD